MTCRALVHADSETYPNPVPLRFVVFQSSVMKASTFVKTTATAPKISAAATHDSVSRLWLDKVTQP